jgi:uncharacterized lipoprotein
MPRWALLVPVFALAGCKAIFPSTTDCTERLPYMDAREAAPLRVPDGVDAPNTQAALRIPEVKTPPRPDDGRCLDYPPRYRTTPAPGQSAPGAGSQPYAPMPGATPPPGAPAVAPGPGA